MSLRRVAVTGIGVICGSGNNRCDFWRSISAGLSGIAFFDGFPGLRFSQGARVRGYRPQEHFTDRDLNLLDPFAQFALVAAREAVQHSGIEWTDDLRLRSGVITGSCVGGKLTEDDAFRELYADHRTRFNPMIIPRTMANSGASMIGMEFGLAGASFTFSTACSSANHALAHAFAMIRDGQLELAVTGGSEAPFTLGHLKAWEGLRVVAPDTCRPFSLDRKGLILGEGAAMMILEPLEAARARGATVYAEIIGAGMTADAHHITQPSFGGAARAMQLALNCAGISKEDVGYINAHGTGTLANDCTETQAIRTVFGEHAGRLNVSSTKSMHGHALGAAGALEAAATVLALHTGVLPPTANFTSADPACDLDIIPNESRRVAVDCAISNSFAFGGLNAVIAFRHA